MMFGNYPKIVRRHAGPGMATGEGDTVIDDRGNSYRIVSEVQAQMIRQSTGGMVYRLHSDGTVR